MRQKLKNLIESGADIEFSVNGKMYTILPWTQEGICIGEQGNDDDQFFADADALLEGYLIDAIPLESLLNRIVIEFSA